MVEYTINTLNPSQTCYLKVQYKFYNAPIKSNQPSSLLVDVLLFVLSVSEAEVERLFSLTGRIKPTVCASFEEKRFLTVIQICHEGLDLMLQKTCTFNIETKSNDHKKKRITPTNQEKQNIWESSLSTEAWY